jgi:hypothetical protein
LYWTPVEFIVAFSYRTLTLGVEISDNGSICTAEAVVLDENFGTIAGAQAEVMDQVETVGVDVTRGGADGRGSGLEVEKKVVVVCNTRLFILLETVASITTDNRTFPLSERSSVS